MSRTTIKTTKTTTKKLATPAPRCTCEAVPYKPTSTPRAPLAPLTGPVGPIPQPSRGEQCDEDRDLVAERVALRSTKGEGDRWSLMDMLTVGLTGDDFARSDPPTRRSSEGAADGRVRRQPETRSQTNMTTTTDTTATYQQIGKLREEALTVCDHMMAQICNLALGIGASLDGLTDAEGDRIWSMTQEQALAECDRVIREAAAQP